MSLTLENAMAYLTHGIYVLTSFYENEINGMIASWVSQVSFTPPQIMVAVHPNRFTHHLIEKSGFFALHALTRAQANLLKRFKGPDPRAKFDALTWSRGQSGCPILDDCAACFECRVSSRYAPGNHTLFIGEIINTIPRPTLSGQDEHTFKKDLLSTVDYQGCYLGKD